MSEAPHGSTGEYCSGWFARLPQRCAFRREPDPLPYLPKVEIVTQQHGGAITVYSEVSAYTEFTIHLPREE